ncbi:hypothetical protein H0H92_013050, partial [Tricholoma furcatifolium]
SQSAYELYGIHVCGFAVNLDPDKSNRTHSAPWGASPEYEKMLQNHKPIIARDLQNWESHLRVSQSIPAGDNHSSLFLVPIKGSASDWSKDQHRHIFSAYIRMGMIPTNYIIKVLALPHKNLCTMQWHFIRLISLYL